MDGLQKKKNEKRKKEIKDKRDAPVASGSAVTGGSFGYSYSSRLALLPLLSRR